MKKLNFILASGLLLCSVLARAEEPPVNPEPAADASARSATTEAKVAGDATAVATPALAATETPPPAKPAESQFFEAPTDQPVAPPPPAAAAAPDLPFPDAPPVPMATPAVAPVLTEIAPLPPVAPAPEPVIPSVAAPTPPPAPVLTPAPAPAPVPVLQPVAAPPPFLALPSGPQTAPSSESMSIPSATSAPNTVITDDSFSDPLYTSIYFGRGSSEISEVSINKLRRSMPDLLKNIDRYPRLVIELAGHADPAEKGDLKTLSLARAQIMKALLVARGIPAERIKTSANGGSRPLRKGGDLGRNSRVEVLTYPE